MPLNDTVARQARPKGKPYKLADQGGLYLWVSSTGAKSWRFDYRHRGRRYTLTIGVYPDIGLASARDRHRGARGQLARDENPATEKKVAIQRARYVALNSFYSVAETWMTNRAPRRSFDWLNGIKRWFKRDVYPVIGTKTLDAITVDDIRRIVKAIADRGTARTAEYTRGAIAQVFHHAILDGRTTQNPARELVGLVECPTSRHHPHIDVQEIPRLFIAIDNYGGRVQTKLALKLLVYTFVRVRELVEATWDEFDFGSTTWTIPSHRMKARKPHIVPLSLQTIELLEQARSAACGSKFVFPSLSRLDRPVSSTTLNFALNEIGYAGKLSPHGLRATASTALNSMGYRPDVIERQLAHTERNSVRAAYDHADHLPDRRQMMQAWADYLDALKHSADVIPLIKPSSI